MDSCFSLHPIGTIFSQGSIVFLNFTSQHQDNARACFSGRSNKPELRHSELLNFIIALFDRMHCWFDRHLPSAQVSASLQQSLSKRLPIQELTNKGIYVIDTDASYAFLIHRVWCFTSSAVCFRPCPQSCGTAGFAPWNTRRNETSRFQSLGHRSLLCALRLNAFLNASRFLFNCMENLKDVRFVVRFRHDNASVPDRGKAA